MTAILYSEGQRDLGDAEPFASDVCEGPLRPLIAHVLGHPDGLVIESRLFSKLHGDKKHGLAPLARKVLRAIRDAEREKDDGIIVVIDRDGKEREKRLERLQEGRSRAREDDRTHDRTSLPCALGVAQVMVESWLLGDAGAWQRAFGDAAPSPPRDPEVDTRAKGSPSYAKAVLEGLLVQAGAPAGVEGYTRLAAQIDTAALERTCTRSFKPFADELRQEFSRLYHSRR